ncbi:hypothetical protein FRX31_012342 [Thalictrum thalictroides]|uniref:Uncharacterized protein n=1 Tax=Thalictrum thalictroides TaxID=46969 RepID=A0A7J6WPL5_THATH|nr:hypothetical protein FRX31_012342 [Thalictrum thalictroides]
MDSNKPIPTSNTTTNTTTPSSSAIPNQELNTTINRIDLLPPHLLLPPHNHSSNYPNVAPEEQIIPSHSHPYQGLHYQPIESQSHQPAFPPNYLVPSISPGYRLLDDSSRILPMYLQQKWDPSVSKEARNRRRMARQMGPNSCRTSEGSSSSGSSSIPPTTTETEDNDITTPDGKVGCLDFLCFELCFFYFIYETL